VWLGHIGTAQALRGNHILAVQAFELAESFAPLGTTELRQYASSLGQLGKTDLQIALLRRALRADPTDAESHHALAQALWDADRGDPEALAEAEEAVRLRDYFPYRYTLGRFYGSLGRLSDAETQYRLVLRHASIPTSEAI
jgi:tetratricopeptide (TPR) repeat protein